MTVQDVLEIATGLALASVAFFLVTYGIRARETWWSDPLGRAIMLGGFAVGSIAAVGSVRRVDDRVSTIDLTHELAVASIFAYLAVSAVWLYKAYVVHRETQRKHDEEDDQ